MAGPAGFDWSEATNESSLFDVFVKQKMAGPAGFEPANAGTKTQCLTAWRRSNLPLFYHNMKKTPNSPKTISIFKKLVLN